MFKYYIFGSLNSTFHDGIHLYGPGAQRHFTYRVKQVLESLLTGNIFERKSTNHNAQNRRPRISHIANMKNLPSPSEKRNQNIYSHAVSQPMINRYAIPVSNKFAPLNY